MIAYNIPESTGDVASQARTRAAARALRHLALSAARHYLALPVPSVLPQLLAASRGPSHRNSLAQPPRRPAWGRCAAALLPQLFPGRGPPRPQSLDAARLPSLTKARLTRRGPSSLAAARVTRGGPSLVTSRLAVIPVAAARVTRRGTPSLAAARVTSRAAARVTRCGLPSLRLAAA